MGKKLYIPIAGTGSREVREGDWYRRGSLFHKTVKKLGYKRVEQDNDPKVPDKGYWSGDLGGLLPQFHRSKDAWKEGAKALAEFIRSRKDELGKAASVTIIAHSHGGQVAAMAIKRLVDCEEQRILSNFRVVTVDMPVRARWILLANMKATYVSALFGVAGRWMHLYVPWSWKFWRAFPRLLGSRFGPRKLRGAHNIGIPGGHSGILKEEQLCLLLEGIP